MINNFDHPNGELYKMLVPINKHLNKIALSILTTVIKVILFANISNMFQVAHSDIRNPGSLI